MDKQELVEVSFNIIVNAGEARTKVYNSFKKMNDGEYDEAAKILEESNQDLLKAHNSQTDLLTRYANDEEIVMDVMLVHAQDHLMTTMTLRETALQMLEMYKKMDPNYKE